MSEFALVAQRLSDSGDVETVAHFGCFPQPELPPFFTEPVVPNNVVLRFAASDTVPRWYDMDSTIIEDVALAPGQAVTIDDLREAVEAIHKLPDVIHQMVRSSLDNQGKVGVPEWVNNNPAEVELAGKRNRGRNRRTKPMVVEGAEQQPEVVEERPEEAAEETQEQPETNAPETAE